MDQSDENGFTGLEASLVLIAFVVVAAVFSYVVLGGGFFTTQTAQAAVYNGVGQASSSMEIVGEVMGIKWETGTEQLDYINVSVTLSAGGTPMDLSQTVISYSDSNNGWQKEYRTASGGIDDCDGVLDTVGAGVDNAGAGDPPLWCVSQFINDQKPTDPNTLLENNEVWILSIQTPATATPNTKFKFNLQPPVGAGLIIIRTLPGDFGLVQMIN